MNTNVALSDCICVCYSIIHYINNNQFLLKNTANLMCNKSEIITQNARRSHFLSAQYAHKRDEWNRAKSGFKATFLVWFV